MLASSLPKVSILIPCYNSENCVEVAIESALEQSYARKEIIVVDDGSNDDSLKRIKKFGDWIYWETRTNHGSNLTRNRLLELSTGQWLQYLDADDYLLPDKLEKQVHFLKKNGPFDVIFSPVIIEHFEKDRRTRNNFYESEGLFDPWVRLAEWRLPQTAGALWHKKSLSQIGGWSTNFSSCQEYELYLRSLKAGQQFGYYAEPLSVYCQWSHNTLSKKSLTNTYRNRLHILDDLENHLKYLNNLTPQRQYAINRARFECARMVWLFDSQWASRIIKRIKISQTGFVPLQDRVPQLYRILFKLAGFSTAETVAALKRKFFL